MKFLGSKAQKIKVSAGRNSPYGEKNPLAGEIFPLYGEKKSLAGEKFSLAGEFLNDSHCFGMEEMVHGTMPVSDADILSSF